MLLADQAFAAKRIALLIGNHSYAKQVGPLVTPPHDVKAVAASLGKVGFTDAEIAINANRTAVLEAIDRHANRLSAAGDGAIVLEKPISRRYMK